jgi:metallo-beta-lactamase class B
MTMLLFALVLAVLAGQSPRDEPIDPFRIADNVYYVGSKDIASYLVTTPEGHIVIDGGYEETAPMIAAHVRALGFAVTDIRILLNTQAHFDHAAGLAELKRLSGARLMVSAPDAPIVEAGGRGDFLLGDRNRFPPAHVDRILNDKDQVRLGGMVLTAHVTAGHTKGCTTWAFDARDRGRTYHVVDVCGLTVLDGTRLSGMPAYPAIASDFERTFRTLRALPCDIFLGAHASYYGGLEKAVRLHQQPQGPNPFVDPDGYRAYVERSEERFRALLAREREKD